MILVVSNARDATADFFEAKLKAAEVPYHRLNTERLTGYSVDFRVEPQETCGAFSLTGDEPVHLGDITAVYYRRPCPPDVPEEVPFALRPWVQSEYRKLWGGLLAACSARTWVNHPATISTANYKPEQLARATRFGLNVPPTRITNDPRSAENFCERLDWNVVVKPIGHGYVRSPGADEDALIYTNRVDRQHRPDLTLVSVCPTLFQAYIEKAVDLRVTVVEAECVAVQLDSQAKEVSRIDCRRDNMTGMQYALVQLPSDLRARIVELTSSYGLHFAAIDLALDRTGRYWFLELNPAGQWAWLEEQAGAPISDALIRALTSA